MSPADKIRQLFAQFGFIECPLTEAQIEKCLNTAFTPNEIYLIGCDVAAGYSFDESLKAMVP